MASQREAVSRLASATLAAQALLYLPCLLLGLAMLASGRLPAADQPVQLAGLLMAAAGALGTQWLYQAHERLRLYSLLQIGARLLTLPALFVLFIRLRVEESPTFAARRHEKRPAVIGELAKHWKLALYLIVLMTAMNFLSHGTGDLYPTFLQKQRGFDTHTTGMLAIVLNVGSIIGAVGFGQFQERMGRRRNLALACVLVIPVIPLWAYSTGLLPLAAGAFLMGLAVQGAWGNIPAYLNELSPPALRAMFPGLVYQLGNLIASRVSPFQAGVAAGRHGDYAYALASVTLVTAIVIIAWIWFGPERREELE